MNIVVSGLDEKTIENRSAIIFTILIVVAPILNQYQVLPLTYIEILSIWGLLLVAKHNRFYLQLSNYIVFMIAGIILTILSTTFNTIFFYSMFGYFTFSIFLSFIHRTISTLFDSRNSFKL